MSTSSFSKKLQLEYSMSKRILLGAMIIHGFNHTLAIGIHRNVTTSGSSELKLPFVPRNLTTRIDLKVDVHYKSA